MSIINIAGYKFIALENLVELQTAFLEKCQTFALRGTILLSTEGININLAGTPENIQQFKIFLQAGARFADITFHQSQSANQPFQYIKVKIKKEIITMRAENIHPEIKSAPSISPQELKQWLDEKRDITLLDTRNAYEVRFGTFKNSINPNLNNFSEFSKVAKTLNPSKPVVMFCTGGIRCEKAALHLLQAGFPNVLQLQSGILGYFKQVGNAHYDGECFVFDERIAVDANLQVTGTQQCKSCQGPIKNIGQHVCEKLTINS
jgi:UPF0176 protein